MTNCVKCVCEYYCGMRENASKTNLTTQPQLSDTQFIWLLFSILLSISSLTKMIRFFSSSSNSWNLSSKCLMFSENTAFVYMTHEYFPVHTFHEFNSIRFYLFWTMESIQTFKPFIWISRKGGYNSKYMYE